MAGIRPDLHESIHWSGRIWRSLAGSGQTCSPESDNGNQMLPDSGDNCIFPFRNFFVRTKRRKIFSKKIIFFENDFVENILQRTPFYVETNGA
jgi:hypothetical protein